MRNVVKVATGALLLVAGAPAFAQDMAAPMAKPAFDGVYVAVSGGRDVQSNDSGAGVVYDRNGDFNFSDAVVNANGTNYLAGNCSGRANGNVPGGFGCAPDRDGWSYYGRVGLDKQRGHIVIGALGEFGRTQIHDYTSGYTTAPANYIFSRSIDWEASGRLRAGYAVHNGLFYATGGVGYTRINHGFSTTNTSNAFSTLVNDRDKFGFVVGGGVEYRIYKAYSIGLEYTYHDYKDGQYDIRATQGTGAVNNAFVLAPYTTGTTLTRSDDSFRWHSIRAVIGYHF